MNYKTSQEKEDIIKIHYTFEHWDKGKIPADFIKVIPVGGKGFELDDISTEKSTNNTYRTTMSFKLVGENVELPTNTIVLYRVLGVFPIINIRGDEFDLPQRLSAQ
ncbi:hypothetical protein [Sporosalibacterium faouarense]|uniref:hypothetical protein n=1 Tax=Sporosalibacterium faouarense TaxID=516123 RepID=UPI001A9C6584|nr:hypothetical protein [Sporosalibacterium faouarense]